MTNARPFLALTALAACATLAFALWLTTDDGPSAPAGDPPAATTPVAAPGTTAPAASGESPPGLDPAAFNQAAFIADMQARFGPHIHRPHAQVRSLEQLISYLRSQYPDDWQSRVHDLLRQLFPARADALYQRFGNLMQYNEWLLQNRADLGRMPAEQRREALWQARRTAFGADAERIWAAELRSQALADALQQPDPQLSTPARLEHFVASVHEIYGEQAPRLLEQRRTELVHRFLDLPAVRDDLAALDPDARRETLRAVRQGLGMDEAALERWEDLDRQRDTLWQAGQQYMQQRQEILASHPPQEAARQVEALREQVFGAQAAQIADEEDGGFFRFAHERRYGRE